MTEYDNTNSGLMFPAGQMEVFRQGKIDIEGEDHEMVICKRITPKGKTVFEVFKKVGAVFPVTEKKSEKSPDMSGEMVTDFGEYKVWGRKKTSRNGMPMTAINLSPPEDRQASTPSPDQNSEPDNKVPTVAPTPDLDGVEDIPF